MFLCFFITLLLISLMCSAKYPLSVLAKALDVLPPASASGMDINCGFSITASNSKLASEIEDKSHKFIVNAFHGYSHNYRCQKKNHPTVVQGAGLEDFETMERIFSASNALASVTRYASPYRRRLFVDAFFRQWDLDKFENLGTFILNNYKQALSTLDRDVPALRQSMERFNLTDADLDRWEEEEAEFFSQLGKEPEANTLQVEYVELLQALQDASAKRTKSNHSYYGSLTFVTETPQSTSSTYSQSTRQTNRLEKERRLAHERYETARSDVVQMELRLGITRRWDSTDREYLEALKYTRERKYHRALDKVHELVVHRLFELQRMNVSGLGKQSLGHNIHCVSLCVVL